MHTASHSWSSFLTSVNGRRGSNQVINGAWSTPIKALWVGVYRWGFRRGHSFSLWLHTIIFQAEIHAHVMENSEKEYTCRKIYSPSDSQAAIKVLDNFKIYSKLVWNYHQPC